MILTCTRCNGTGIDPDTEETCLTCGGTGESKTYNNWRIVLHQLDSIIAEQASQREDLTAALEAIWNKVKNL